MANMGHTAEQMRAVSDDKSIASFLQVQDRSVSINPVVAAAVDVAV